MPELKEAIKYDGEKPRTDLLPAHALLDIAQVFSYGAKKYSNWNYLSCGGLKYSRLIGALLRHTFSFMNGEDVDKESGYSHLSHIGCCIMMLMETHRLYPENDDRLHKFLEQDAKRD